MEERKERIYIPHTYTHDKFTVFFYGERVYLSDTNVPIGQCCVDIMNMDENLLDELENRAKIFAVEARALLPKKTNSAASSVQKKLNAVLDILFSLPVYRSLNMNRDLSYHVMERLFADKEKWTLVQKTHSEERKMYQNMVVELERFAEKMRILRRQIQSITETYFKPLERRNCKAYAKAYASYYSDALRTAAVFFHEDFKQSFPMQVSFVPMMHQTNEGEIFIAEKATFNRLTDFLRTEFYRGLAVGNAPRRCHNCGKYFLLTAGYNTCYCNNIAPGETERTC